MSRAYADEIADMLQSWGNVVVRPMFGGFSLYRDTIIFGIILRDTLYFKVGSTNEADYINSGSEQFTEKIGKGDKERVAKMPYWKVPVDVLDNADDLILWANKAFQAGIAHKKANPSSKASSSKAKAPKPLKKLPQQTDGHEEGNAQKIAVKRSSSTVRADDTGGTVRADGTGRSGGTERSSARTVNRSTKKKSG